MIIINPDSFVRPPRCKTHVSLNKKLSYVAWQEMASKRKDKQIQCPDCIRWFFKEEYYNI